MPNVSWCNQGQADIEDNDHRVLAAAGPVPAKLSCLSPYATDAGDPGSKTALGKHGRVTTRSKSPGPTPTLPDANLRYSDSLNISKRAHWVACLLGRTPASEGPGTAARI